MLDEIKETLAMTVTVSLKELIESGAHFGHQSRRWNPKMKPYLHDVRDGVHIFDLTKTKELLEEALGVLKKFAKEKKSILLVGTKKQAKKKVEEVAKEAGIYYVTERWLGGLITNFDQIKKSVTKLSEMKEMMATGGYKDFTKKERLLKKREIDRLERFFGGIAGIEAIPDLLVVIDVKRERGATKEANMKDIPTIAIVDSNCDPTEVSYPIPMNDDATKAIEYVLELIRQAILEGKGKKTKRVIKSKKKAAKKEK